MTSIEALNEPAGFVDDGGKLVSVTRQYYYGAPLPSQNRGPALTLGPDSYGRLRQSTPNVALSVHDAFLPLSSWSDAFPSDRYSSVLLDTHIYTVFDPNSVALSFSQRVQAYCNMHQGLARSDSHILTRVLPLLFRRQRS